MASSLSTTSPPPGPALSWAGSKILQGKELTGEFWSFGILLLWVFVCVSETGHQPTGVFSCTNRCFCWYLIHLDGWGFFLPFLLECLCGHRQLMKRTKERQCCKIIRKEKGNTVQTNAFCYYNAIFSLVCGPYCSLHWLFSGDKKFIKWLFILQYQYVLSQIVYSLPLIFF